MPRRRRPAHELTTDEVLNRILPRPVREQITQEAKNARKSGGKGSTRKHSN
jgi:hypothetical protein